MREIVWAVHIETVDIREPRYAYYARSHERYLVGYDDGSVVDMSLESLLERLAK